MIMHKIFTYLQYLLPQHFLSKILEKLGSSQTVWFKNLLITTFVKHYHVDMSIAQMTDPKAYPNFNCFFVRRIKSALRPIAMGEDEVVSPVDGSLSQAGKIHKGMLLQAKQIYYDLDALLAQDKNLVDCFEGGPFATFYLAPENYHRIHMPLSGELKKTIYVPGSLFSVNRLATEIIPQVYTRNERLVSFFHTQAGPMCIILVAALIVGNIHTTWMQGPIRRKGLSVETFPHAPLLPKGAELGHFTLGSTVILLFGKDKIKWHFPKASTVKFGQCIGSTS